MLSWDVVEGEAGVDDVDVDVDVVFHHLASSSMASGCGRGTRRTESREVRLVSYGLPSTFPLYF